MAIVKKPAPVARHPSKSPTKTAVSKKPAPKKATSRNPTPKKGAPKRKVKASVRRGPELLLALTEALRRVALRRIGELQPLDAAGILAFEEAAGVAMSPSLYAMLSFDAGQMKRDYEWFDKKGRLLARPILEVLGEHAGPVVEMYAPLCAARFPGKAIALDQGSDSLRLLYFGAPDELGEYPVLFANHEDVPMVGVEAAGFDVYAGRMVGLDVLNADKLAKARARALLGTELWRASSQDPSPRSPRSPRPTPSLPPGSVVHDVSRAPLPAPGRPGPVAPNAAPTKTRSLTDPQLARALVERAAEGAVARLAELARDAKARKRPRSVLDAALMAAVGAGEVEALRLLLDAGASPNARDRACCALARLVHQPNATELARVLLGAGANPNGPSVNGKTALHDAVQSGSFTLVEALLGAGGDPNRGDSHGNSPLFFSAGTSDIRPGPELVDLLIDHGADPNGSRKMHTPLRAALENGWSPHAERLLARGADPNRAVERAYLRTTTLHLAFERGLDALVPKLLAAGADRLRKDQRGISFEGIWGPNGEDVRPLSVHYVKSERPQRVTIEARFAVLNPAHLGVANAAYDPSRWADLVSHGLSGGDVFFPGTGELVVESGMPFKPTKSGGFLERRYQLSCSAIAPEFLYVVGQTLFGAAPAFAGAAVNHVVRCVALSIRGEHPGQTELDGETLRTWLATGAFHPRAYGARLPFELEIRPGPASISVAICERSALDPARVESHLRAWLATQNLWRRREGEARVVGLVAQRGSAGVFELRGFDVTTQRRAQGFPFELEAPTALLRNTLVALHQTMPLRRVVWQVG